MDMQYHWLVDQVKQKSYDVQCHPGQENPGDYITKHHTPSQHIKVRPYYLHTPKFLRYLPGDLPPSIMGGCVDSLRGNPLGYQILLLLP